ncbi:MAG: hypothetical protein WC749_06695, partial [Dehalococcoidia bacterium]
YLAKLARLTALSERVLAGKLAGRLYKDKKEVGKTKKKAPEMSRATRQAGDQLEEYCLCLLLKFPALRDMASDLGPDHLERAENREVFVAWQGSSAIEDVKANLDAALHEHLKALVDRQMPPLDTKEQERALTDCSRRLKMRSLRSQLVFEADSAIEDGANPQESSTRLTELQRRHASLS